MRYLLIAVRGICAYHIIYKTSPSEIGFDLVTFALGYNSGKLTRVIDVNTHIAPLQ